MCCIMGYAGHDLPKETFAEYLLRTASRGPDDQRVIETEFGLLGFGRLAIMGLTPEGMQPFTRGADCVACNGELYGFRPVKAELEAEGYTFASDSDCEIILPLYYKYGLDMFKHLDAEFAMILYDSRKKLLIAARDPIGIRPLFYGYSESGHIAFASEAKNLVGLCKKIYPFPIGSYYCNGQFVRYCDIADTPAYTQDELPEILANIREKLVAGVDDGAHLSVDGESHGVGDGMVHMDELHGELACPDALARLYGDELGGFHQLVLLQLQLDETGGEAGAVDGHVDLLEHIGDGADVVLVAVGDEQAPNPGFVLDEIRHIGDHAVDAVHVITGEGHTTVHHDDLTAVFIGGHVLADLVETAKGNDFQFFCHRYRNSFAERPEKGGNM